MKQTYQMSSKKRGTPRPPPTFMNDIDIDIEDSEEEGNFSVEYADDSFCCSVDRPIETPEDHTIVRHIASFLTLSDAASMVSMDRIVSQQSISTSQMGRSVPSWASFGIATPETPGLMALSPSEGGIMAFHDNTDEEHARDDHNIRKNLNQQRKRWVQQKLSQAVLSHPRSMRAFCLDAHKAAMDITRQRSKELSNTLDPETYIEPRKDKEQSQQIKIIQHLIHGILHNVPLTVALDLVDTIRETALDTSFALVQITSTGINGIVSAVVGVIDIIYEILLRLNPFALLDAIISMQFNYMGKTSEALVSGIQSVATGVGSARNMAIQRLSRGGGGMIRVGGGASSASLHQQTKKSRNDDLNQQLLRKLSTINSAAHVISYHEQECDALTRHAKKRVQRMMHYDVSLRPFVATVLMQPPEVAQDPTMSEFEHGYLSRRNSIDPRFSPSSDASSDSPFMCTPKSFPPTPGSRRLVLARGNRFAEDVIFLAREKLRVEGGLHSNNERTRAMAMALREGSRLAVFNAADVGNGIALSCGQHIATKVGSVLYCSTRSMVPILRNCFVYFEMSVLAQFDGSSTGLQTSMATLSIGLSTLEMPLNTLVGSWQGSIGMVTTGQILTAGQWGSPGDTSLSSYGEGATVGCLVCLDDGSAFETWDGVMVTAAVTFNVNGCVVSPPANTAPVGMGFDPHHQHHQKGFDGQLTLQSLVPMEEELFPTLTLHSSSTQVMCRFSSEDILAEFRTQIGAPLGVTVYSVDGSVLFDDNE